MVIAKEMSLALNQQRQQEKLFQERKAHLILYLIVFLGEEIRENMQRSPSIVGFEKVEGDLKGELAAGQWSHFFAAAVLRGDWTDVKAPIIKKTIAGTGEKQVPLVIPEKNHTTDSFTIEDIFSDISLSRIYTASRIKN